MAPTPGCAVSCCPPQTANAAPGSATARTAASSATPLMFRLLVVARVEAWRPAEHTPAPEGVQSAREDERDGRDHGGQGRTTHRAQEERLGRVGGERDRQRRP